MEELHYIAQSTYAAVEGICKSKLDTSVLEKEITIDNYKTLCCNRNKHGVHVACNVRKGLSYDNLCFPIRVKIFFRNFTA